MQTSQNYEQAPEISNRHYEYGKYDWNNQLTNTSKIWREHPLQAFSQNRFCIFWRGPVWARYTQQDPLQILLLFCTTFNLSPDQTTHNIRCYYSTNCNTIQIWSWCSRYPSSVGDGYPAIYVASYVGRKSEVKKCWQKGLKMLRAWKSILLSICSIIKQLSCSILRNIVWF